MSYPSIFLACTLALAACGDDASEQTEIPEPKAQPITLEDGRRFIGRWAPSEDSCTTEWWRFWHDELLTGEAGIRCKILPPDARNSDTDVRALCSENGVATRETWVIDYEEVSPPRMTLKRRDDTPSITLVRCA